MNKWITNHAEIFTRDLLKQAHGGCFDEFNRISVEVLSVVAVQVKSVQDAIRDKKATFNFMGENISLCATVGIFITMNPGSLFFFNFA